MATAADTNGKPAKAKRRWFRPRFTLAALLVLITIVAIPLGYVAQRRAWNLQRREARRQLEELGASLQPPDLSLASPAPSGLSAYWTKLLLEDDEEVFYVQIGRGTSQGVLQTPADLTALRYFPEIRELCLWYGPDVTDESLAVVVFLPRLTDLYVREMPRVTGSFLAHVANRSGLESLRLEELNSLSSPELRTIGEMRQLRCLHLLDCPQVTDELLEGVEIRPELGELFVENCDVGDRTLKRWLTQAKIGRLSLRCRMTRAIVPALSTQSGLLTLSIANAPLVDDDFAFLSKCENLYVLELSAMPIEGRLLGWVKNPGAIDQLRLRSTLLRDDQLSHLSRFDGLQWLDLSWTPITGEGFPRELRVGNLLMQLAGTELTDAGKLRLSQLKGGIRMGDMPLNWSFEDSSRYTNATFKPGSLWIRESRFELPGRQYGPYYSAKELSFDQGPLDNFPKEAMASVMRLHEMARTEKRDWSSKEEE